MLTSNEILAILRKNLPRLTALGVRRIGLSGSASRDEAQIGSDLDFVVELSPKTFDAYMDLKFFLEELFGTAVDLVLLGSIKPRLRDRILAETLCAA